MASSGDGSHQSAAVNAAMKACEHFAGHVAVLVPQVNSTSPALERVKSCAPLHATAFSNQSHATSLRRYVDAGMSGSGSCL